MNELRRIHRCARIVTRAMALVIPSAVLPWTNLNCAEKTAQPNSAAAVKAPPAAGPEASAVPIDMSLGWCAGHGVPESVCTRCDDELIPKFQLAGDWCKEHGLPESQCEQCNPGVAAKWAAIHPSPAKRDTHAGANGPAPADEGRADIRLETNRRILTGDNDPLCKIDQLRVRFRDGTVLEKAGIQTATASRRRISAVIEAPAEVEFDDTRVTHVTPRVGGVVSEAPVRAGDDVAVGDLLAVIESAPLGEAKSRYIELRENLALAQAASDRARQVYEGTQQLLDACKADPTADEVRETLRSVRVGEAKSRLLRAHADLLLARSTELRERRLLAENITSERDYEKARSESAAAEAGFVALLEEIAFSSDRDRIAAERAAQVARSAFEAAERKLHILGLSHEQITASDTGNDETLSRYELRSPAAGRVIDRHLAVGESVDESTALLTIADVTAMWLVIDARERDLSELRPGLPVIFTVDGLRGQSFEGQIFWIASRVDDRTRTVQVRASLPNPAAVLRAKMFGAARIIAHQDESVVAVPEEAVQTDGCCQLVFVRQEENSFEPRKVVLGTSVNGFVEILGGVREGELVATAGSFLMKTEILKGNLGAGCCEADRGR